MEKVKVSPQDLYLLQKYSFTVDEYSGYPTASVSGVKIPLHQFLFPHVGDEKVIDHMNRDKLDNRRENLRVVSQNLNILNIEKNRKGSSIIKKGEKGPYEARIRFKNKNYYLGSYPTEEQAKLVISYCRDLREKALKRGL